MSKPASQVLYRTYRPSRFAEVRGQDHIVKVLEAEVASGSFAHAYLFCGGRGTGKTSVARIFASALGTSPNDIYEIDAASHTSVEDIRALNESVFTLPLESLYKVYILDEVHMLSRSAANALLKTLEEPPPHVIFILATTETHKIPETVLSRCEVFQFKKPSLTILRETIEAVAKKEKVGIDRTSTELIALLGDGSFRDTLGILQKVISYSGEKGKIGEEDVRVVVGAPTSELVFTILSSLSALDHAGVLRAIKTAKEYNIDMLVFTKLLLESMRALLFLKMGDGDATDYIPFSDKDTLVTLAKTDTVVDSKALYHVLSAYEKIPQSYIDSLPLELAFLDIITEKKAVGK